MYTDPAQYPAGLPQPPRRKRHTARNVILICAGALAVIITAAGVISAAAGGSGKPPGGTVAAPATPVVAPLVTDPSGNECTSLDPAGYCPGQDPVTPPATPSPTTVTFYVSGWGQPSITYGSDSDNRDGGGHLGELGDGNGVPWHASVPFDGSAMYYTISAQLEGSGNITCKIVVTGPGLQPLTVAHGHASGGYNICSAQAAPSDSTGTSWQSEG